MVARGVLVVIVELSDLRRDLADLPALHVALLLALENGTVSMSRMCKLEIPRPRSRGAPEHDSIRDLPMYLLEAP